MPSNRSKNSLFVIWIVTAAVILLADQYTKILITGSFQLGESKPVIQGLFNLVRAHNTGAAFSFLASEAGWQRWLFTAIGVIAAAFIFTMLRSHSTQKLFAFALTFILGGALGNVVDRILYGYVVDFLDFYYRGYHWYAFNVADAAIVTGVALLLIDGMIRGK